MDMVLLPSNILSVLVIFLSWARPGGGGASEYSKLFLLNQSVIFFIRNIMYVFEKEYFPLYISCTYDKIQTGFKQVSHTGLTSDKKEHSCKGALAMIFKAIW